MPILPNRVNPAHEAYQANRSALEAQLAAHDEQLRLVNLGGGEKYIARHRQRGKMLVRERVEALLDPDSPFLELSPLAAWGSQFPVGAGTVAGIGVVEGVECMITGSDPTMRGGASNPYTLKKSLRTNEIISENRLPTISLTESGGADLPTQSEIFIPGGRGFRDITQASAAGIPQVSLVFGNSTAGGAYVPGMSDYVVMIKERSKGFLRKRGPGPRGAGRAPRYDPDQLLGIPSADPKVPFDPRDVIARVVDDSDFDEFKPLYGTSLVTGFAELHGYPIGILANHHGVLFSEESEKAAQFIQLANQIDTPLVFLQNTTGYMVGKEFEQRGIIKDGAKMINAVSNSSVPHLTINMAASYGAGNYGMCGRAFGPRFLFAWPNAKSAVMGPAQLAGVIDEEADAAMRAMIEDQIERESLAMFMSGKIYDDGIIDPRDTRTVLGLCLSIIDNQAIHGTRGYGVFRM